MHLSKLTELYTKKSEIFIVCKLYLNRADGFVLWFVFFFKESEIAIFRRKRGRGARINVGETILKIPGRIWTQTCHHGGDKELGLRWGLQVKGNGACGHPGIVNRVNARDLDLGFLVSNHPLLLTHGLR